MHWEDDAVVREFAARAPDVRLAALLAERTFERALDIGCAGGRNTVLLAQHGIEVWAVDAARAMVAETRRRLEPLLGAAVAERRVQHARMDDLRAFADDCFDLVLALGVFHAASSWAEWQRAVQEAARVLRPGGRLLLSHFTPATDLTGDGVRAIAPHVYEGMPDGPGVLLDAEELERELRRYGLEPAAPLQTLGARASATGTLLKRAAASA